MLILRRSDCKGLDPSIVARMVEPSFDDERDLLVVINRETDHAADTPRAASLDTPADCRSAAEELFT